MRALFALDGPRARKAIRRIAFNEKVDAKLRLAALVEIPRSRVGKADMGRVHLDVCRR
jgi:hypothetical protein